MAKGNKKKRGRGRPALPPGEGKRHAVGLRTTKELKDRLEQASREAGRSVAQEIEIRLERSFAAEDGITGTLGSAWGSRSAGMAMLIGRILNSATQAGRLGGGEGDCLDDPAAFQLAQIAIERLLAAAAPRQDAATHETPAWFGRQLSVWTLLALSDTGSSSDPVKTLLGEKLLARLGSVRELSLPLQAGKESDQ